MGQSLISSLPSTLLAALACFPPLVKAPPQVQHNRQNKEKKTPLLNLNISAAFVQWTRHLSTNNYSGASSLHCFPLHHCLCRVCLQGHLAFINCQVEQWFQVDQTILIFFSFSDWHHPWWTKFWCNGLNWPNLIRIPPI